MRPDKRGALRKVLRCNAKILLSSGQALSAKTVDISPDGICLLVTEQITFSQPCTISFEPLINGKMRKVTITARAVYSVFSGTEGFRIGFQFAQVDTFNMSVIDELLAF